VKTSAIPQGHAGRLRPDPGVEGQAQADVFWGGEATLFDQLAIRGCSNRSTSEGDVDEIPASIGSPCRALKDPKKVLVGTTLEPYVLSTATLLKRWRGDQGLGRPAQPETQRQIAQCTPDRSSSSHASYEVILRPTAGRKAGSAHKLGANTGIFTPAPATCPNVVAKASFARRGLPFPSYMAFAECWAV